MLDLTYIIDHLDAVKTNIINRGRDPKAMGLDALPKFVAEKKEVQQTFETKRAEQKKASKSKPTPEHITTMKVLAEEVKRLEHRVRELDAAIDHIVQHIPNMTHPDSPIGGEKDYTVIEERGTIPHFSFPAKDHEELLTARDMIDFERGAKVAGSKFYYSKNDLVRLNMALLHYGMDVLANRGFDIFETPDLAKEEIARGAGFDPRGDEDQTYTILHTDFSLIGTAEITMLGYHANEVIDLSTGPKKYAALSHCFRKEAGAYGRTSKGLYRVHQFTKLEMFIFCTPKQSEALHRELLDIEKEICDGLGIAYRVIDIPTGDLGGPAYRKFDLEAWMTMNAGGGEETGGYGEITSTSNCTDYQSRRLNIKYKTDTDKSAYVHTLNGTAVVLSRFPIAIIEQGQQADGTIHIPKVLQPYMGKDHI